MSDNVYHPDHYVVNSVKIEPIELTGRLPSLVGQAVNYVMRSRFKGTHDEDIAKAINCLQIQLDMEDMFFNIGDKHQTLIEDVSDWKLNTSNFSVNVGAGVMLLGHLQVGANYNIVCGKTGEVTVFDGVREVVRGRSNTWQISAAYYF